MDCVIINLDDFIIFTLERGHENCSPQTSRIWAICCFLRVSLVCCRFISRWHWYVLQNKNMKGKCKGFSINFKSKEWNLNVYHFEEALPICSTQSWVGSYGWSSSQYYIGKSFWCYISNGLWKQNHLPSHYNKSWPYKNLLFTTAHNLTLPHMKTNNWWFYEMETLYIIRVDPDLWW